MVRQTALVGVDAREGALARPRGSGEAQTALGEEMLAPEGVDGDGQQGLELEVELVGLVAVDH